MKKITLTLVICFVIASTFAQTTGRLENLKDASGTTYNYVGEIKNKQPNGVGVAIYNNGTIIRYAGNFVDGQFNGKGVEFFSNGTFLSGEWRNGKLNGKGASLNKDGDIYVGEFVDGKKEGRGRFVYNDKSILCGNLKNDSYEGRCIYIVSSGMTIADNIYADGKKNGTGYQYELDSKKLYEGTWANGDWVTSGTASYASFLKNEKFYSEKTDDQILMGSIDRTNKNLLQDTAFFYNFKNYHRYFGYYDKGFLADGIIVGDSTRFFGKMDDNGAYGPGSLYKIKKYYDEGNYKNDFMDGSNNLSIDLDRKTVYYGNTDNGALTGKAYYINNYNEIFVGDFDKGQFTGKGYVVYNTGKTVKGNFNNYELTTLTSFTDKNGAVIDLKPKSFEQALNLVAGELSNDLVVFKTKDNIDNVSDDYYSAKKSIVNFPGSIGSNFVFEDNDFYQGYQADFYKGKNFQAAKAQYDKLCKDIAASNLHLKNSVSPAKLVGTIEKANEAASTRTKFTLSNSGLSGYNIYAALKYKDGGYTVSLVAGDVEYNDDQAKD